MAASPLTTDDAATLDPGACQMENEHRHYRHRSELDVVPACNVFANVELAAGLQRVTLEGERHRDSVVFQFKKVLLPADVFGGALGVSAAVVRGTGDNAGSRQHVLTGLFTRSLGGNSMHLNLGVVNDREATDGTHSRILTWGAAIERDITGRFTLVIEASGQQHAPGQAQLGLRWFGIPKYVQLTGSVGARRGQGREGRWVSLGVRFETGGPLP